MTGRRGRRPEQLLDNLQEREGTVNCKRQHYILHGGKCYGPVNKTDYRMCSDNLIPGVSVCCL